MKTIYLSDEGFAQVEAALAARAEELQELVDLATVRCGAGSDAVQDEQAKLDQLTRAAYEFYGLSSWRSNGARAFPAGSVFTSKGASACTTNTN